MDVKDVVGADDAGFGRVLFPEKAGEEGDVDADPIVVDTDSSQLAWPEACNASRSEGWNASCFVGYPVDDSEYGIKERVHSADLDEVILQG